MTFATRNAGAGRIGIAIFILFLFGMAMAALMWTVVPPENKEAFVMLVGGLNTALGGIIQFFFNIATRRTNAQ